MYTSMSLDFSKFYELSDPLASRPLRLSDKGYSDWLTKDQAIELFRGKLKLDNPLRLGAYRGGQATDFLWSGLIPLVCISTRVLELLRVNNITGWTTYSVGIFGLKGELLPGYHGFAVTGSECKRDRNRSQVITKPAPTPTGQTYQVYKGLYFDEQDWDGSDFFIVFNFIILTEKVKRIFKQERITNVRLTPLPEIELNVYLDKFENGFQVFD